MQRRASLMDGSKKLFNVSLQINVSPKVSTRHAQYYLQAQVHDHDLAWFGPPHMDRLWLGRCLKEFLLDRVELSPDASEQSALGDLKCDANCVNAFMLACKEMYCVLATHDIWMFTAQDRAFTYVSITASQTARDDSPAPLPNVKMSSFAPLLHSLRTRSRTQSWVPPPTSPSSTTFPAWSSWAILSLRACTQ